MEPSLKQLNQQIETLALETVMLDAGDIPALGKVLKSVEAVLKLSKKAKKDALATVAGAMQQYIEQVILGEKTEPAPFAEAVSLLQAICREASRGKEFHGRERMRAVLKNLGRDLPETPQALTACEAAANPLPESASAGQNAAASQASNSSRGRGPHRELDAEDLEILSDFVAESLENLGMIEIRLMDLEQDPGDMEAVNAVFRPFHTLKGVSGFLNLDKINRLSHVAENLLESLRAGELTVDSEIVDVILDSVDALKRMIASVGASLEGGRPSEGPEDCGPLIARIERFNAASAAGDKRPGQRLVAGGALSRPEVGEGLDTRRRRDGGKIGEIPVEHAKVNPRPVASALRNQKRSQAPAALQIKVDTVKLDNIVDMVSELAIAQAMLRQHALIQGCTDRKLHQITNQLNLIASGLQSTAMSLRMVPIKHTFLKMPRIVRDLSRKAGKEIRLAMSGEQTEIDRNMVEALYEPMVHMIRNAVDHGLETAAERAALGKPRQGTIFLKSYHKGGNIVIEIGDDGRGLNREKILHKAIAVGLIKPEEKLTDAEIDHLIFQPGFSTAENVTDISGRGVGADVVRKTVEKLRGRVDIRSTPGAGTVFLIRLPLTLAIVDGMIVKIGEDRYIIPTLNVQESLRPREQDYFTVQGTGEMIRVRNDLLPMMRLNRLLGRNGSRSADSKAPPWEKLVVVVDYQERKKCLLVDELIGQEEVVIKSLGGWLNDVKGVAGSVILGDGRVGIILDVGAIFELAARQA